MFTNNIKKTKFMILHFVFLSINFYFIVTFFVMFALSIFMEIFTTIPFSFTLFKYCCLLSGILTVVFLIIFVYRDYKEFKRVKAKE